MSPDQLFIVALVTAGFGAITTIAMGFIAYLTAKIRAEQTANANEHRQNIGELARAIDGVKSEVVAAVKSAAIQEGVRLGARGGDSAAAAQQATDRLAEVASESDEATRSANEIAAQAELVILAVPGVTVVIPDRPEKS